MNGLSDDPHALFGSWYAKASRHPEIADASAVNLATASKDGMPSNRMVLLKGHDASGFVIYTNLGSRKASELTANPHAALCFYWAPLGLQVRIEGSVQPVSDEEADIYFASRPLASRIGAWASKQSAPLESRGKLLARIARFTSSFALKDPGRPPFWSGFRILPRRFEFWTEGEYRVHDRVLFEKQDNDRWERYLLYP
ncbi:pyridoxamine 5'-phosphate oxidase [Qipengyuania aquimaris]|uniref:pyridoxamine 5'-phosphate oxidase n=1 Tax=Qipengyuania aquimaris TaxID=255984 RepID=UPI001C97E80D|nr:pyridoxamine 5'-phosphate oxidase [Qipengyuania aquimaris]MBY6129445.1 pyridoxamine 5'-phosphate oxidase [Qipengyuania aquimaris]